MFQSFLSSKAKKLRVFNRLAKVLFPVFLFSVSTSATPDSLVGVQGIHIYAQATVTEHSGITPTHTIRLLELVDETSISNAVAEALLETNAMPEKRRALLNFDFDFLALVKNSSLALGDDGEDLVVYDADSDILPDQGIWLDKSITDVASRVDSFFEQYVEAGGQLDLVALSYNGVDLSVSSLIEASDSFGGPGAYFETIQEDPRFANIVDELGFSDLSVLLDDSDDTLEQRERWNAVMQQRIAAYLNDAFYQPIHAHFPDAQLVARDYFKQSGDFSTEQMKQRFADTSGALVGNGQASVLPPVNDFESFKQSVDSIRGMVLTSNKPVYPFIEATSLSGSDAAAWYQESILHSGLSTAGQFVYLNQAAIGEESTLLSSTAIELASQLGSGEISSTLDNLSLLSENFVLTKGATESGALWRFTPSLADGESIESVVLQSVPAKLSVAGSILSIADTSVSILESSVAAKGIWLESAESAEIGDCSGELAVNEHCYAVFSGGIDTDSKASLTLESSEPLSINETGSQQVLFERQWRSGGADVGLAQQDDFSIRYATAITVEGGEYGFSIAADDSVRLWVNGELVIDGDVTETIATRDISANLNLSAGAHNVLLEYTDIADVAAVKLSLNRVLPACEVAEGTACLVFLNAEGESVATTRTIEQTSNSLAFSFDAFELPEGVSSDGLVMRWETVFISESGQYDFAVNQGSGALKIWLDDVLIHDANIDGSVVIPKSLTSGEHRLRVELQPVMGSFFDVSWLKQAQAMDCSVIPNNAFCGEFFENRTLTGTAAQIQQTDIIDFNWGRAAPFEDFVRDSFSARWVGQFAFDAGSYTFRPVTDDGVRVWVDDELIIDYWRGQSATERPGSIRLESGNHIVKMEYYEGGGDASAKLSWSKAEGGCESVPENEFCAEYYDNNTLIGSPVLRRNDAAIDFSWGRGSPDALLPVDYFSARWVGDFDFEAGDYNLGLSIDDGARVWIGGKRVFDSWNRGGTFAETFKVAAGRHRVVVDYREWAHGAKAQVNWKKSSPCEFIPEDQFCGEFFSNTNLAGLPVYHEVSDAINFDWKRLSPNADTVPVDRFTARWEGDFTFEAGKYNFDTNTDDGVRVWVGDSETPIIDSWNRGGTYHAELELPAGKHRVKVEYREWGGNARAILKWTKGQFCDTIPNGAFCGEYYANNTLDGFPVLAKQDPSIDFDWRANSPEPDVVPKDKFSIRWQGDFDFTGSDYRFVSRGDDAIQVWVDDELIIDQPKYNGYKELSHDLSVLEGIHRVKVEMKENYGYARAKVFWEQKHDCTGIPSGSFCGSYFKGTELTGNVQRTQSTDKINFSWNDVRPMHGLSNNSYSVRWLGKFDFAEGYYKFAGNVDDGVRVWVGDQKVIDQWSSNSRFDGNVQATPWITADEHIVKVEYRERWGNANISMDWEPVADCNTAPEDAFCIELYGNRTLSNHPTVVEKVESIDNDWEYEKPNEMVWKDSFSARWKGKYQFDGGNYRFTTSTDDGVRLFVDGEEIISKWRYQGETAYNQVVALDAGQHELQMEYFEGGGAAAAHLSWESLASCATTPEDKFCGEFFDSRDLSGTPVDSQFADRIDFDWTNQAPGEFVNRDKFSVRWKGVFNFDGGMYRLLTDFDDGMRVKIDGELVIDGWSRQWPYYGKLRQLQRISEGQHTVEVEYREDWGNAVAKFWWEKAPDCEEVPTGKFCAAFFDGIDLNTDKLLDTRFDESIDFNWGSGYPYAGSNVPRDKFSVRWVGAFDFTEGEYTFNVRTDDGFRLWVDDELLIDAWKPQGATDYRKRLVLEPGSHTVKAEYFESYGGAVAKVNWTLDQANVPKKPESLAATEVTQDRAVLTWDTEELVSEYRIMRDGELLTTTTGGSLIDNAVIVTNEHIYQVIARWENGRESEAATVVVNIPDTDVPSAVQALRVSNVTATSVSLVWDASTDNVAVAGYKLLRDGVEVSQASGNGVTDEGLVSYSQHRYQVVAFDSSGNQSIASDALTVFTEDNVGPTTPGSVNATLQSDGQIALSWGAARDNVGVASYAIVRDGERIATTTQTRYVDSTAVESTTYDYQIVAIDSSGNESALTAAVVITSGDVTAPSAPDSLTANITGSKSITLGWTPAVDNTAVVVYRVIRDGRLLATSTLERYTDTQISSGYQYAYEVKAIDAAGNVSLASNNVELGLSQICSSTETLFETQLADTLTTNCVTCHTAGGMAQTTRLILSNVGAANDVNLQAVNTLVQQLDKALILDKASGVLSHGGGAALTQGSAGYQVMEQVLTELQSPESCSGAEPVHESSILTDSLVNNCASCHGTFGQSSGPATPTISGMKSSYIATVMKDYQSGERAATVMDRIAKGYTNEEIQRIADILSEQPYVAAEQSVDLGLAGQGETLHLENCASCHTSNGRSDFWTGTRLAGQWKPYLETTLLDYAQGRSQGPEEMMTQIDAVFESEGEDGIKALAAFYANVKSDSEAPEIPDAVSVAAYTTDSITLTWMDSDDDWGIDHYEIYRDGVLVGTTRFNTFTDTGLSTGNYQYTIIAVDISGQKSIASEVVSAALSTDSASPDGIELLDYQSTLRKSALLLLGRFPTPEELATAETEEGFRQTLATMMSAEKALDAFAYRAGHEVFLSRGAASANGTGGIRSEDFPVLDTLTSSERNLVTSAIREEPIYLMQHILDQNRPWTEMLTADYTVVNPASANALDVTLLDEGFSDITDMSERQRAKVNKLSARFANKAFPHAGVLTMNAWLSRFPTTDTNRNRHRSAKLFKQFLGVDIEALAQRPLDDSGNGDYLVPTMENPNCMTCHTIMDPVAGAFKNWSADNRYARNFNGERGDKDSLSYSYKYRSYPKNHQGQSWYHSGDTWYRDVLMPGMNDKVMPGAYGEYGGATLTASANLLENPSAEAGTAGWTMLSGDMEAVNSTSCERVITAAQSGESLFQLGQCATAQETVLAVQEIDIAEHAADIDAETVKVALGAHFRSKQNRDKPSVWVSFLDEAGEIIAESEVLSDSRTWSWRNLTTEQQIPANTRRLRFNMKGQRSSYRWADEYVDAYVDDVFMQIHTPTKNVEVSDTSVDSLQWLGQQMVKDSRFAKGGVYFWYRSLFKREPLSAPIDPGAEGYAIALAAFNEQDAVMESLAKRFARDNGNGAWNVKDLLVDLVASPLFRASSGRLSEEEQDALSDIGLSRLLIPEEVNRKLKAVTGYEWRSFQETRAWSDRMGLFYGGFDGGRLQNTTNTEMNSMMSKIPERMAIDMSCSMVYNEFRKDVGDRGLLKFVESGDTPAYEDVSTMASNMLVNPGAEQGMTAWVLETGEARILSGARGCDGGPSIMSGSAIFNPGGICSSTSALGRLYQDVDITAWSDVIDQGDSQALFGAAIRSWSTNNDEASVYLTFRDAAGNELGNSEMISSVQGAWKNVADFVAVPVGTRVIRYVMQGRRLSTHANNDSFVDDTYLRLLLPDSDYMPAGERRIRENLQYLHQRFLNEPLALNDPELDRTFNLFSEVWAERNETENMACRLYNEWEDPNYTKRAWSMVMMYLMTDARFLYE